MQYNGTSVLDRAEAARVSRTSHLPDDLAKLHDKAVVRRAAVAREIGGYRNKIDACRGEFDTLDAIVGTLRSPESTPAEIDWARNQARRLLDGQTGDVLSAPSGGAR